MLLLYKSFQRGYYKRKWIWGVSNLTEAGRTCSFLWLFQHLIDLFVSPSEYSRPFKYPQFLRIKPPRAQWTHWQHGYTALSGSWGFCNVFLIMPTQLAIKTFPLSTPIYYLIYSPFPLLYFYFLLKRGFYKKEGKAYEAREICVIQHLTDSVKPLPISRFISIANITMAQNSNILVA